MTHGERRLERTLGGNSGALDEAEQKTFYVWHPWQPRSVWVVPMSRAKPKVGDVVEIELPGGGVAYGRVLRDASMAIYDQVWSSGRELPIGDRAFLFTVGIYEDALKKLPVVAHDASREPADDWPPPYCVTDKLSGRKSIYHHGEVRPAEPSECEGLEPAAVYDLHHIVERIQTSRGSSAKYDVRESRRPSEPNDSR